VEAASLVLTFFKVLIIAKLLILMFSKRSFATFTNGNKNQSKLVVAAIETSPKAG
jgi:hypothetical protein